MKSQQEIQQILDDSELKSEYRRQLSDAIKMAMDYHGTETEYKELFKTLIELEEWLKEVFGTDNDNRFPIELEEEILEKWHTVQEQRRKIDDVIGISAKSLEQFIESSLKGHGLETDELGDICKVSLDGIILPPDEAPVIIENGSGNGFEDPRFQERLKNLLVALEANGIFTDDVVLISAGLRKGMMRKVSYTIIEIPKLNREILVCNQVGEATFVVYGILGRKTLLSEDKRSLQEKYGARVVRVIYSNPGQWESEVLDHLFKDVDVDKLEKVDVKEREGLRAEILKREPTAEEWANMSYYKEKLGFEIAGMKLRAIAKKFGIEGDPIGYRKLFLELGRKIYGDEHECLQYAELSADELRTMIKEKIPTPEEWVSLDKKGKEELKIARMGLCAIASIFGVKRDTAGSHSRHLILGRKIYGEEHGCLQDLNLEKLRRRIIEKIPTAEKWASMEQVDARRVKIGKMKLNAIAREFGIEGSPTSYRSVLIALGREIYGDDHGCLQEIAPDELRVKILEKMPTAEEWAEMSSEERTIFRIAKMSLRTVATKFDIQGNPISRLDVHFELGRRIYGEDTDCLKGFIADELRIKILKVMPNAEEWARMSNSDKRVLKIDRIKITAIARVFGIAGNPIQTRSVHLELGKRIYGEDHECLKEIILWELRNKIIEEVPTAEEWAGMSSEERSKFKVEGMGLAAISTQFGISENPTQRMSAHLELGRKLYGKNHECLKFNPSTSTQSTKKGVRVGKRPDHLAEYSTDELRDKIIEKVPTAEEWAGMKYKEKTSFKIEKAGLVALATKFGVKGSPIGSRSTHLELGKKIYGENHECLQYEEQPKLSTEELQVKIKEKVPTAEEWAVMGPKERREFKIASMGLHAIATQFGMKKSPVHQPSAHFELGRKVYGEDHECFKELTLEELRIKIIEKVPTFQEWTGMTSLQRRAFMIGRLKLNAIARQFGVTGSPLQRKSVHLELGRKIYESVAVSV